MHNIFEMGFDIMTKDPEAFAEGLKIAAAAQRGARQNRLCKTCQVSGHRFGT